MADREIILQHTAFTSGELSPYVLGRSDLAKQRTGCTVLRNFQVDFRGGAMSRPGTQYVGPVPPVVSVLCGGGVVIDYPPHSRLIPFIFNGTDDNSLELVLGDQVMAVVIDGAYVTDVTYNITGVSLGSPATVQFSGSFSGPGLFSISGISGTTQLNGRIFIGSPFGGEVVLYDMFGNPIDSTDYGAYISGGTISNVFAVPTPWTQNNLLPDTLSGEPGLKYSQSADIVTVTHPAYPPYQIQRISDNNWNVVPVIFGTSEPTPDIPAPGIATVPTPPSGGYLFHSGYNYLVTAISADGTEESLPQEFPVNAVVPMTGNAPPTMGLYTGVYVTLFCDQVIDPDGRSPSAYNWYRTPEIVGASPTNTSLFGLIGSTSGPAYIDQNSVPDFSTTPPQQTPTFQNGQIDSVDVTSEGAAYDQYLTYIAITTSTGSGALLTPVIDPVSGEILDVIVVRPGINYNPSDTIQAIDQTGAGSGFAGTLTTSSPNNYPGSCAYYQQRLFFAGSYADPQTVWGSQIGNYSNMNVSNPVRDSDAITIAVASGGANTSEEVSQLKHLVPMNVGMIALSAGATYAITGGGPSTAITPSSFSAQPQAYTGASDVRPIAIDYDLILNSARGNTVYAGSYNFFVNIFTFQDISFYSNHLFYGRYLVDWCYAEQSWRTIWACRDDGILLGCSYLKTQDVYGWSRHDTNGQFLSTASNPEGTENAVYFIVNRFLPGALAAGFPGGQIPCVERLALRYMGENPALNVAADPENWWGVDCGAALAHTYPDATATVTANNGGVELDEIVSGGTDYSDDTFATITDLGGTGSGASATLTISGGVGGPMTVVQSAVSIGDTAISVTLPGAPTAGNWLVALVGQWENAGAAAGWTQAGSYFPGTTNFFIGVFYRRVQSGDPDGPWVPAIEVAGNAAALYEISWNGAEFPGFQVDGEGDITGGGTITAGNGLIGAFATSLQLGMAIGQQDASVSPTMNGWIVDQAAGPSSGGSDGTVTLTAAHRTVTGGDTLDASITYADSTVAGLAYISINLSEIVGTGSIVAVTIVPGSGYTDPVLNITDPMGTGSGADITLSTLDGMILAATSAVFSDDNIGNVVRLGGGIGVITGITDTQHVSIDFSGQSGPGRPIQALIPNSGTAKDQFGNLIPAATVPFPAVSGQWTMDAPVTYIQGLDQFAGGTVWGLADGNVVQALPVSVDGSVTLPQPASSIVLGAPYQCQLQTRRIASEQVVLEGRQKAVPAMTVLEFQSRGLKAGSSFASVAPLKDRMGSQQPSNAPMPLIDGMQHFISDPEYTLDGYTCFQQDYPLPVTIQVVAAETELGTSPP